MMIAAMKATTNVIDMAIIIPTASSLSSVPIYSVGTVSMSDANLAFSTAISAAITCLKVELIIVIGTTSLEIWRAPAGAEDEFSALPVCHPKAL